MKKMALPRTFNLRPGMSLCIGGVGRVDFEEVRVHFEFSIVVDIVFIFFISVNNYIPSWHNQMLLE